MADYKKNVAILEKLANPTKESAQKLAYGTMLQNIPKFNSAKCPKRALRATNLRIAENEAPRPQNRVYLSFPQLQVSVFAGGASTQTTLKTQDALSGFPLTPDFVTPNSNSPSSNQFVGGIGTTLLFQFVTNSSGFDTGIAIANTSCDPFSAPGRSGPPAGTCTLNFYGLGAPQAPPFSAGIDANIFIFSGGEATVNGTPGVTPPGMDSIKVKDNFMITVGPIVIIPVSPSLSLSLTGGVAELNQSDKYSCSQYCAFAPAVPAFTNSHDAWVPGGFAGIGVLMPFSFLGIPGATFGVDYKHIFFGSNNVTLGSAVAGREIIEHQSPDMNLFNRV